MWKFLIKGIINNFKKEKQYKAAIEANVVAQKNPHWNAKNKKYVQVERKLNQQIRT